MAKHTNKSSLRLKREAFYRKLAAKAKYTTSLLHLGQALPVKKIVPGSEEVRWFSRRALRGQSTQLLRLLLRLGLRHDRFDVLYNSQGKRGDTAVHLAARRENFERVDLLLDFVAADGRNLADRYGLTHFHAACMSGHAATVRRFIESGRVDLDQRIQNCFSSHTRVPTSALHMAVKYGRLEVARLLLQAGADPNILDRRGRTALHRICEDGVARTKGLENFRFHADLTYRRMIRYNCSSRNSNVRSPADYIEIANSVRNHHHDRLNYRPEAALSIVKLLLDHGLDVNRKDHGGASPLQHAVAYLQFELVEELLARGAEVRDVVFKGGYFNLAYRFPSLRISENLIGIVEILRRYGYEMSRDSELTVMHFLMNINMHNYDPEIDQPHLVLEYGTEGKIGDFIDRFERDIAEGSMLANMSTFSQLMNKSHEMNAIRRHLEVLYAGGMHKSANIRRLVETFKRACSRYRDYFVAENFSWRYGGPDGETLLRPAQSSRVSTTLAKSTTDERNASCVGSDESVEVDGLSEDAKEDDWDVEAQDDFDTFVKEIERAGEIAIGPSGATILDICRAAPDKRYDILLSATKWPVIDEELRIKKFNAIGNVLMGILDKALVREYAAVASCKFLLSLLPISMPYYCCRKIFGYLSNEDLFNLCTAAAHIC